MGDRQSRSRASVAAAILPIAAVALINEIFRADQPITPLFPLAFVSAASRRVKGLDSLDAADVVWHAERLSLEETA